MAIHHPTPPLGGGERPRLPSAQVGPVTQAIRAMRAADVNTGNLGITALIAITGLDMGSAHIQGRGSFTHGIRALSRAEVETLVEGLIDLLDAMDGDPDVELDEADGPEGDDEREGDPAENGIGDYDGLAEQVGLALSQRAYA